MNLDDFSADWRQWITESENAKRITSHKTITVTLGNASEVTVVYADGPGPALNCPLYRLIHTE